MNGKQLKNSILQLAIQGKLVPQDANDEPVSELLKRIRKDKEALVKAKKIKKGKPLPEITEDEKPFEIPESWEWVRLGVISSFNGGFAFQSHKYVESGIRVLRISDFNECGINSKSPVFYEESESLRKYLLSEGDIIMCMTGGTVGKCCIVRKIDSPSYVNQRVADIKINHSVDVDYIFNVIRSSYIQSIIEDCKNSTNDNISSSLIQGFLIPLPPLEEQKRIVAKIEELMPIVDEYDKAQTELDKLNAEMPERLKKSVLQEAIQGKLGTNNPDDEPASELLKRIRKEKETLVKAKKIKKEKPLPAITDEEKPFDIPDNWEWCRVADISESYIGLTYRPTDVSENGTVVLRSSNIQNGRIVLDDLVKVSVPISEKLTVKESDILICARNGSAKLVGKSALIPKEADGMSFGAFMAICKTPFFSYIYHFLQSDLFFSQLRIVSGTTTINQLTQKNFNSFVLPLPPLAEQRRIVEKLDAILPQIENIK